jgi:hypothetical protein
MSLCDWLTEALGLDTIGQHVTGAKVFGRGEEALVDVYLAAAKPLHFKRYDRVGEPRALKLALVTQTGVHKKFSADLAGEIASAIYRLAEHHDEADATDAAREWGYEYLRLATTEIVDLEDQAERWRAFAEMGRIAPARDAGEDRSRRRSPPRRSSWWTRPAATASYGAAGCRPTSSARSAGATPRKRSPPSWNAPAGSAAAPKAASRRHARATATGASCGRSTPSQPAGRRLGERR